MRNEAGQRLIEFCQENALVIANNLFQQHKRSISPYWRLDFQIKVLSYQISSEASVLGLELDEFLLCPLILSSANQHPWCPSPYKDTSPIQLGISLRGLIFT